MEIILGITVFMFLLAAYSVAVMIVEANKIVKDEDPVPFDDLPGFYEDVEYSERPYIETLRETSA